MDLMFPIFFQLGSGTRPTWEPPADVFTTRQGIRVLVALPGVSAARLEVSLVGRTLLVSGIRALPAELREAKVERIEIPHGRFERRFELPPGEHEIGTTSLEDGCLSVEVLRR